VCVCVLKFGLRCSMILANLHAADYCVGVRVSIGFILVLKQQQQQLEEQQPQQQQATTIERQS